MQEDEIFETDAPKNRFFKWIFIIGAVIVVMFLLFPFIKMLLFKVLNSGKKF